MEQASSFRNKFLIGAIFILVFGLAWWAGRVFFSNQDAVMAFFERFPFGLAAIILVVTYVLSSFIPFDVKDILKIVAALLFGAVWSSVFIWVAEMINNAMLFHLSRKLGRAWIEKRFGLHGKDVRWVERLCGVWQIFVLRIIPVVPYRILDIAYGLTGVSFRRYFAISAVASPLRIFWLQFILAALGGAVFQPEKVTEYFVSHPEVIRFGFLYLLFSFAAAFILSRKLK